MRARERALEACRIVGVAGHDFRARHRQRSRLVGIGLACNRTRREAPFGIGQDRADEAAPLRAGGADDRDDLLLCHLSIFLSRER